VVKRNFRIEGYGDQKACNKNSESRPAVEKESNPLSSFLEHPDHKKKR